MSSDYDEIRFVNEPPYVFIDWDMSSKCNYKCSYCTPASHDGKIDFPDINVVKQFVDKIDIEYNGIKEYATYNIIGGEPTLWNKFEEFSTYIKQVNPKNKLQILTNGNRTLNWWQRNIRYIDTVILTVHVAQADIKELVNKFNALDTNAYIELQIGLDVAVFDKSIEYFHYAKEHINENIKLSAKPLLKLLSDPEWMSYTEEQQRIIQDLTPTTDDTITPVKFAKFKNDVVIEPARLNDLILKQQNNWYGWACWIGIDTLTVTREGFVKIGSMCNPNLKLGSIYNLDFSIPKIPVRCKYTSCSCLTDIYTKKKKYYYDNTL